MKRIKATWSMRQCMAVGINGQSQQIIEQRCLSRAAAWHRRAALARAAPFHAESSPVVRCWKWQCHQAISVPKLTRFASEIEPGRANAKGRMAARPSHQRIISFLAAERMPARRSCAVYALANASSMAAKLIVLTRGVWLVLRRCQRRNVGNAIARYRRK